MKSNIYREDTRLADDYADVALGSRRVSNPSAASRTRKETPRMHRMNLDENPKIREQRRKSPAKPKEKGHDNNSFIFDKRTHLAFGIFLCVLAVVMVGTAISYIVHGQVDQSTILGRSMTEVVESGDEIQTAGGVVGARLAHFLLVDTLGIGSFVIALYIFLLGLGLMRVKKCSFWSLSFKSLFTAVAVSVIAGMLTYSRESFFHLGGNHGYYINQLLRDYSGALGTFAVSVVLFGILIAIFYNPLVRFFKASAEAIPKIMRRSRSAEPVTATTAPEPTSPISTLDDPQEEENPGRETSDEEKPVEIAGKQAPHIDDFDPLASGVATTDGFDIDEPIDIIAASKEISKTVRPAGSVSDKSVPLRAPGEPEMVIVNAGECKKEDEPASDVTGQPIANGAHIGLDKPYDHTAELSSYVFPPIDLLVDRPKTFVINEEEQAANKTMIVNTLRSFGIEIARIEATIGPTVTLYEIVPAEGVRISKIKSLEDDIAMKLAALGIRIIAPIPGKGTIGIEVPNRKPQTVSIRSILDSKEYHNASKMALPMALGATISNGIFIADLAKMPHLLVAGATGQGKSVGLNCIIASLLYAKHPSELKFVLIDPKMVEFSLYRRLEHHYLAKLPDEDSAIITDPNKVVATLNSLCTEMDNRYELLSQAEVRSIEEYNAKFSQRRLNPENGHRYLPYIVMIVDEFADLIMTAGKDVSMPIARIAQKARAVGMHMIIATQRPSTDVITGMIKANFPGRIAFRVSQMVDSRTILDSPGANRLIGRGDMLFSHNNSLERVQCAFIDTEEIEALVQHIDNQIGYPTAYLLPEPAPAEESGSGMVEIGKNDQKFFECARFVATQNVASASMLQRKFQIGFNKAGRIMDQLCSLGVVGPQDGAKPRQVLMTSDEVERILTSL